ncbi:glycosyltransferase [Sphingomonas glacialis]|uniref:Glycosyltransferase n=2 Tax=Sphingomonas glacialis TaxID=658225 RepID=A0A502FPZ4_9SPHN|nr:glycosyltransferase [Sphingomonas glacialis]
MYLSDTIRSVIFQSGDFDISYVVRDGGSSDGTAGIVRQWQAFVKRSPGLLNCRSVELLYESGADTGMYDALNKGFERLSVSAPDAMTWINSDDMLAPGALATVASAFNGLPDAELVGGRAAWLNGDGENMGVAPVMGFARAFLAAGLHDGRKRPFVMQEGTFWKRRVWEEVGGLDPTLRLAGDWDLWRKMARTTEYIALDALIAYHRRRPGQLSENITKYHVEIDAVLDRSGRADYEALAEGYESDGQSAPAESRPQPVMAPVGKYRPDLRNWTKIMSLVGQGPAPRLYSDGGAATALRGRVVDGMGAPEGPFPEFDLPSGVRWVQAGEATVAFEVSDPGRYLVRLQCRSIYDQTNVRIRSHGRLLYEATIPASLESQSHELLFPVVFERGRNDLAILPEHPLASPDLRLLYIDVLAWHVDGPASASAFSADSNANRSANDGEWRANVSAGARFESGNEGGGGLEIFSDRTGPRTIQLQILRNSTGARDFRATISGMTSGWTKAIDAGNEAALTVAFEGFFFAGRTVMRIEARDVAGSDDFSVKDIAFTDQ